MTTARVLLDKDRTAHVARLTLNAPERKNSYDPEMRRETLAHTGEHSGRARSDGGPAVTVDAEQRRVDDHSRVG